MRISYIQTIRSKLDNAPLRVGLLTVECFPQEMLQTHTCRFYARSFMRSPCIRHWLPQQSRLRLGLDWPDHAVHLIEQMAYLGTTGLKEGLPKQHLLASFLEGSAAVDACPYPKMIANDTETKYVGTSQRPWARNYPK